MSLNVEGTITQLKARINASGDTIQTVTLEVHGEFSQLHSMLRKPLAITFEESNGEIKTDQNN